MVAKFELEVDVEGSVDMVDCREEIGIIGDGGGYEGASISRRPQASLCLDSHRTALRLSVQPEP